MRHSYSQCLARQWKACSRKRQKQRKAVSVPVSRPVSAAVPFTETLEVLPEQPSNLFDAAGEPHRLVAERSDDGDYSSGCEGDGGGEREEDLEALPFLPLLFDE